MGNPHCLDKFDTGNACRPGAVAHNLRCLQVSPREVQRIKKSRRRDDRRTVLIVVKNRNIHQFAQTLLDDETVGRLDVFQVDATERRTEVAHGIDELLNVLGLDFKIY